MRVGIGLFIFALTLYLLHYSPLQAEAAGGRRPVWTDFCPKGLENAEYKEIQWFWPEGTKSTQSIYNYWAERRVEFEQNLAECDELNGGPDNSCYNALRARQTFVHEQYNRDVKQKQITEQIWKDAHDKGSRPVMINIFVK